MFSYSEENRTNQEKMLQQKDCTRLFQIKHSQRLLNCCHPYSINSLSLAIPKVQNFQISVCVYKDEKETMK